LFRLLISLLLFSSIYPSAFSLDNFDDFGAEVVNEDIFKRRTWTSASGSKTQATFIRVKMDKVVVQSLDGTELEIPIFNLCKEDRILLDKFQIENSSPSEIDFSLHRFWTNMDGKKIEAKIHDASKASVQILLKNGKKFRLSKDSLSPNDQVYIEKYLQGKDMLTDDQILKRLTMYKWRNTPSGSWDYRFEFKTTKTADNWRVVKWIFYNQRGRSGGYYDPYQLRTSNYSAYSFSGFYPNTYRENRTGSWKLEPNGIVKSNFGTWQFPLKDQNNKVLIGTQSTYPTLYGSTSFD